MRKIKIVDLPVVTDEPYESTNEALKASIKKWETIFVLHCDNKLVSNWFADTCALCSLFIKNDILGECAHCPIKKKTGSTQCRNTPFIAYSAYASECIYQANRGNNYMINFLKLANLARAEVVFLRSLLPQKWTVELSGMVRGIEAEDEDEAKSIAMFDILDIENANDWTVKVYRE
jgi:hypothetical protein